MTFDPLQLSGFEPNGDRAMILNREVNRRLIDSLAYVAEELGDQLGCSPERIHDWAAAAADTLDRLEPLAHLLFHAIVAEVNDGEEDHARAVMQQLLALPAVRDGSPVVSADADLQDPVPLPLFARFADVEEANHLDLIVPGAAAADRARPLVEQGLALIERNDPDLAAEVAPLVRQIVLVDQGSAQKFNAPAVSCFRHWGALLLHTDVPGGALGVVEMLAHESTHLMLFALALDEPLLTNAPDELYHSPLRNKPRTMDGVYHAMIVSGRITRALLRQAAALEDSEASGSAHAGAVRAVADFDECLAIVEPSARLTPLGAKILAECKQGVAELRGALSEDRATINAMA